MELAKPCVERAESLDGKEVDPESERKPMLKEEQFAFDEDKAPETNSRVNAKREAIVSDIQLDANK